MVLKRIQIKNIPPLEPEVEEEEVEEEEVDSIETMNNEGNGLPNDKNKEEYIKLMKPISDDRTNNMNQYLMKGFELLAIQFGSKGVIGDINISQ